MVVSLNAGNPVYRLPNTIILSIGTPNRAILTPNPKLQLVVWGSAGTWVSGGKGRLR